MKALFLDRDGTLIADKHYLSDPAGVEILPGVADGLRRAIDLGYKLFLFTNQSGVGRGMFTLDDARRVNERMEEMLALPQRPLFTAICMAPETAEQPMVYRKPSPRFILEMIDEYQLDPAQCTMVGDRESDIQAGLNANIRVAAVCHGKLDTAGWAKAGFANLPVYADFAAFADSLT